MTLFLSIILWAVLLPILPILYFMQKNECKPKKNIIVGVTLPYEAQGDAEVLALLERYGRELGEGSAVLVRGKLSVRDEKPPQIICDEVYPLRSGGGLPPEAQGRRPASTVQVLEGKVLWLRLAGMDPVLLGHINRVFSMFPGSTPAKIYLADTGKQLGSTCLLGRSLVDELVEVLGAENVIIR